MKLFLVVVVVVASVVIIIIITVKIIMYWSNADWLISGPEITRNGRSE